MTVENQRLPDDIRVPAATTEVRRVWVASETHPRLVEKADGTVLTGAGSAAPATRTTIDVDAVDVTGARDTPEEALANLLTALETLGLITDSTTVT